MSLSVHQYSLLVFGEDGAPFRANTFESGTIAWAKRNGFLVLTQTCPTMYRLTDAGRERLKALDAVTIANGVE